MIYFDNSATTRYKPEGVFGGANAAMRRLSANPGRGSHALALKAASLVHTARETMAKELGARPDRVIFTSGCTHALNLAIIGGQRKGHVVTTAYEHNSVLRPLYRLTQTTDLSVSVIEPRKDAAKQIERALRKDTYLVAVNHVSNVTGEIAPIEEIAYICNKNGVLLLVDGAQSVGYQAIDMEKTGIDYLAVAPHKGLHALTGVGCLAISERAPLLPLMTGGTGTASASLAQPTDLPDGFEAGTLPLVSISSLPPAVGWTRKNRAQNAKRIAELSECLLDGLRAIDGVTLYTPPHLRNGIISFNVGSLSSSNVCDQMNEKYGICLRGGLHCAPLIHHFLGTRERGAVRISVGVDNTAEDCGSVLKAVYELSRSC